MFGKNPIVGGVQLGHQHLKPQNHASKGVVASMPLSTDMAGLAARRMSAKRPAIKAALGKGK